MGFNFRAAAEGFTFQHEETDTGGTKFPRQVDTTAHHPETGEQVGSARYFPPKRKGGPIHIDNVRADAPGAGSAMLNEIENRHPGSSTKFLYQVKRNNNNPDKTGHAHERAGAVSDWDTHYPNLASTVHRGFSLRLPDWSPHTMNASAKVVNSSDSTKEQHLHELHAAIPQGQAVGMHWTEDEHAARQFAHNAVSDHRTDVPVVLHAQTPARKDIETRRDHLYRGGVFAYGDEHSPENEVPVRKGRTVKVTGISWRPDAAHPDADEHGWVHHNYEEPMHHTAALTEEDDDASSVDQHGDELDQTTGPQAPEAVAGDETPAACSYCGSTAFEGLTDNGRVRQATCSACGGTMSAHEGAQWTPELIGDPSNHPKPDGDPHSGGVGGAAAVGMDPIVRDQSRMAARIPSAKCETCKGKGIVSWMDEDPDWQGEPDENPGKVHTDKCDDCSGTGRSPETSDEEIAAQKKAWDDRRAQDLKNHIQEKHPVGKVVTYDDIRGCSPSCPVGREWDKRRQPFHYTGKLTDPEMHKVMSQFGHNRQTGQQHPHREHTLTPVKHAGFKGYVEGYEGHHEEMKETDRELSGDDHHSGGGDFDEDLHDQTAPDPNTHENAHHEEHGEYPDSYYERHDEAYAKAKQEKEDAVAPVAHHGGVFNMLSNEMERDYPSWHTKGEIRKVDVSKHNVYATQPHVVDRHMNRYLKNPGDTVAHVKEHGMNLAQEMYPGTHRPMFIKHENNLFTVEGHHRTASALLRKEPVEAHVYDADKHGFPHYDDDEDYGESFDKHEGLQKHSMLMGADCDFDIEDPREAHQHALRHHDDGVCTLTEAARHREKQRNSKQAAVDGPDWCTWRHAAQCTFPNDRNNTLLAIPQVRGACPWTTRYAQQICPISEPGPQALMQRKGSEDTSYRMQHTAPDADYGAPLHNIEEMMPGFYDHPEYYHYGHEDFHTSANAIRSARGNPEKMVNIYRALPAEHAGKGIRPGDWVSTSKNYARGEGRWNDDPKHDYPVIHAKVPAKHLHTEGDVHEWGYNGPDVVKPHSVAFKGGYHQEVRQRADGTVQPVQRKPKNPERQAADGLKEKGYTFSHFGDTVAAYGPEEDWAGRVRAHPEGTHEVEIDPAHKHMHAPLEEHMRNMLKQGSAKTALSVPQAYELARVARQNPEMAFHVVATWSDVRNKAKRIRSEGRVMIKTATNEGLAGMVEGDHGTYENMIVYRPGTRKIADWSCNCEWGDWAWKRIRFHGRQCSHSLALQYEAQSRGMFGKEVKLGSLTIKADDEPKPLPTGEHYFYRLHHPAVPFGPEHAQSYGMHGGDGPQQGYSTFRNPHDLHHYMHEMDWVDHPDVDWHERKVIGFHGKEVGKGLDQEPLAVPHGSTPDEHMDWDEFQKRLQHTPGQPTWSLSRAYRGSLVTTPISIIAHSLVEADEDPGDIMKLLMAYGLSHSGALELITASSWSDDWDEDEDEGDPNHHSNERGEQEWFHGSRHVLKPGQELSGGHAKANQGYGQPGKHVYYTGRPDVASYFAEAGDGPDHDLNAKPRVYKVRPMEGHEVDPDEDEEFQSFRSHRVKVVGEVPFDHEGFRKLHEGSLRLIAEEEEHRRKCPFCGGGLSEKAIENHKCPHCGHPIGHTGSANMTEAEENERRKKHHHTVDTRRHAPNFGYGIPGWIGLPIGNCGQCSGWGCGHCGGTGQVAQDGHGHTANPVPDQNGDEGQMMSGGISDTSSLHHQSAYFHNTFRELHPGEELKPANELGLKNRWEDDPHYSPHHVYMWHSDAHQHDGLPEDFKEEFGDHTYEVEPIGKVEADPERDSAREFERSQGTPDDVPLMSDFTHRAPRARVVRKVEGAKQDGPSCSGVALKAADTGRVLMLQRGLGEDHPAAGKWEFPGGHHEQGDTTSLHAGIREWEEEVGQQFPEGGTVHHTWTSPDGVYQGHVVVIPSEKDLAMHQGRVVPNPDDPKGDEHEQAAWWDIGHAKGNKVLRDEVRAHTPWNEIAKAGEQKTASHSSMNTSFEGETLQRFHALHAHDEKGWAATFGWAPDSGTVDNIEVRPNLRRKGGSSRAWYHGTSTTNMSNIQEKGLRNPYLTSEYDQAVYYAGVEQAEKGGHRVVMVVNPDHSKLRVDRAALQEPIGRKPVNLSREPEDHEWQVSNRYAKSVRHEGDVPPHQITHHWVLKENEPDKYGLPRQATASAWDPLTGEGETPGFPYAAPLHSNSKNPASTGFATSEDPKSWTNENEIPDHLLPSSSYDSSYYGMLNDEPEGALPSTDGGDPDGYQPPETYGSIADVEESLSPNQFTGSVTDIVASFQATAGAKSIMAKTPASTPGGGDVSFDFAAAARQYLAQDKGMQKSALKDFSFPEQQELINEGKRDGVRARNFSNLQIEGTHYEALGHALGLEDEDAEGIFS